MHISNKIQKVKEIIIAFGNFGDIEVNSDVIASLMEEFEKYGFIPNPISIVQVELPSNTPKQMYRPGLINKNNQCSIEILPERISIEFTNTTYRSDVFDYMKTLLKKFNKKSNRLAHNILFEWNENINSIESDLFMSYGNFKSNGLIEWTIHSVERELLDAINEDINIGVDIIKATVQLSPTENKEKVFIKYDINTIGESTDFRFNYQAIDIFYDSIESIVETNWKTKFKDEEAI